MIRLRRGSALPKRAQAQMNSNSNSPPNAPAANPDPASWLFPVAKLDESLPRWLHIGGEYRDRLEVPRGIGYTRTNDFYLLNRFRLTRAIRPKQRLTVSW